LKDIKIQAKNAHQTSNHLGLPLFQEPVGD